MIFEVEAVRVEQHLHSRDQVPYALPPFRVFADSEQDARERAEIILCSDLVAVTISVEEV